LFSVNIYIRTKTLDDFDIIDWKVADLHEIWDEFDYEIERVYQVIGDYGIKDSFRNDTNKKLNNVGKYINHYINNYNVAYSWCVNSCVYQCIYLDAKDEYKYKFTVDFNSKELAENPLQMFGLTAETRAKWLK